MTKKLLVTVVCLLSLSLAAGQQAGTAKPSKTTSKTATSANGNIADQIKKLEQDWAQAVLKRGAAAVDEYEADDITSTDPTGRVTDKAQDKLDFTSGDYKVESMELSDLKAKVYGNTAVATGTNTFKGTFKGQDISGAYRFTDTWVKRNGKWQVVASQATKLVQ